MDIPQSGGAFSTNMQLSPPKGFQNHAQTSKSGDGGDILRVSGKNSYKLRLTLDLNYKVIFVF
jgi:hypothetical protein